MFPARSPDPRGAVHRLARPGGWGAGRPRDGPTVGGVFTPWGNVAVIALALVFAVVTLREVGQLRRRGEDGWSGRRLRLAALVAVVVTQVVALT